MSQPQPEEQPPSTVVTGPRAEGAGRPSWNLSVDALPARRPGDGDPFALLQERLAAFAWMLTVVFTLHGVRLFWNVDPWNAAMQGASTLAMAGVGWWLTRPRPSLRGLRTAETVLLVVPAVFLLHHQATTAAQIARSGQPEWALAEVKHCGLYWFALILAYGMLIPNSWRRTAAATFTLAALPALCTTALGSKFPELHEALNLRRTIDLGLMMTLGAAVATFGTHTMTDLRHEVFHARQVGPYRLKRPLGAQGLGDVYLAEHELLKRPCVVKLVHGDRQHDPWALAQFEQEVRATASLTHWNVVDVYDYGHGADGSFYYVMEYLPGLTLAEIVRRFGPMPAERVWSLVRQTADALCEAHSVQLLHRDINPSNLIAAKRGGEYDVAKLFDFGLVREFDEPAEDLDAAVVQSTVSPAFTAPELLQGEHGDVRVDLYSLGAVALFLLTGKAERDPSSETPTTNTDARPSLASVALRCTALDPSARPESAQSLLQLLDACRESGVWTAADARAWWQAHMPEV